MAMNTRNSESCLTEQKLHEVDVLLKSFDEEMVRFAEVAGISLNTVKYHRLSHYTQTVRLLGHPREYNTDMFETQHRVTKAAYR